MGSKISSLEGFILMSFSLVIDLIGVVLLIFLLDDFWLTDLFSWLTQIYFNFKGIPARYDLVGNIGETIPYSGALPWKSVFMAITIYQANRQSREIAATPKLPAPRVIKTPVGGLKKAA